MAYSPAGWSSPRPRKDTEPPKALRGQRGAPGVYRHARNDGALDHVKTSGPGEKSPDAAQLLSHRDGGGQRSRESTKPTPLEAPGAANAKELVPVIMIVEKAK